MNIPPLRTIIWWIFWIFLIWWIANNPDQAGNLIHNFVGFVNKLATGMSKLLNRA